MNDPKSTSRKDAFSNVKRTVQQKLRTMQDTWLSNKADEIQAYADKHDMKNFYSALNTIYGPASSGSTPLLSADGETLITEKAKLLERWAEHFDSVLNRPSTINDEAILRLPQVEINHSLAELPTVLETHKAIKLLSSGKAPGADSIPAEIYKAGGPKMVKKLTDLFCVMWRQKRIP
jgi:hypothetical protein